MPQFITKRHLDVIMPMHAYRPNEINKEFSDFLLRNPETSKKPIAKDEPISYMNMLMESDEDALLPKTVPSRERTSRLSRRR